MIALLVFKSFLHVCWSVDVIFSLVYFSNWLSCYAAHVAVGTWQWINMNCGKKFWHQSWYLGYCFTTGRVNSSDIWKCLNGNMVRNSSGERERKIIQWELSVAGNLCFGRGVDVSSEKMRAMSNRRCSVAFGVSPVFRNLFQLPPPVLTCIFYFWWSCYRLSLAWSGVSSGKWPFQVVGCEFLTSPKSSG